MKRTRTACLLAAVAAPCLLAQAPPEGGGAVTLGGTAYRFAPESLMASAGAGPKALELRGRLVPTDGGDPLDLDLIVMDGHTIYRLELVHRAGGREAARWAATLKTRVAAEGPPHPGNGDRATFKVSGPLVGLVDGAQKRSQWSGSLWSTFSVEVVP